MSVSYKKGTLVAPVECIEERNPLSTLLFNRMVSRSYSFIRAASSFVSKLAPLLLL